MRAMCCYVLFVAKFSVVRCSLRYLAPVLIRVLAYKVDTEHSAQSFKHIHKINSETLLENRRVQRGNAALLLYRARIVVQYVPLVRQILPFASLCAAIEICTYLFE